MNCFEPNVRRKLSRAGYDEIAANVERMHTRLLKQRQPMVNTLANDSEEGVTIGHCFVLWQAGLHRVERLMLSCGSALGNNDVYGLAVMMRALLESTAVITSICAQLHKWAEGAMSYEDFDAAVTAALVGSRSEVIEQGPKSTNIMTHIKRADRFIEERRLFPVSGPIHTMYDVLSEYAHPNMTSNSSSFTLNEVGVYTFNHGGQISQRQIDLLGMLASSLQIYSSVSDFFHGILVDTAPTEGGGIVVPWPTKQA